MRGMKSRTLLIHGIGFLIARAAFLGMNPLAIGYFTAAYLEGTGRGLALVAAFLGICSVMDFTGILIYSFTLIMSVVILELPFVRKRNIPKTVLYIIPSAALCFFSLMQATSGGDFSQNVTLSVLEAIIALVSAGIFRNGIRYILQTSKGYKMINEQMVSVAMLVAVIIYAAPDFQNSYVAWLDSAVFFVILFFTYKYGVGQGAITGAVCGFALCLKGAPMECIGLYTLMGIFPAVFREMGRFPTAVIYFITASLMGLMNKNMALATNEISALFTALILFLLLPGSMIFRIDAAGGTGKQELLAAENLRKIARTRMKIFSDSFIKLSKTLEDLSENQTKLKQSELDRIFEDISEKLCKNCNNCGLCWEQKFQKTYEAACTMFEIAEKKGVLAKEDIPAEFLSDCICADQFIEETNRGFEIAKLNHIWRSRISETREVIAEQLRELSSVIQDITGDIYETSKGLYADEDRIMRKLKAGHIQAKDITILERSDKRKEIYLSAASQGGRCITAKEAAAVISDALGVKMRASESSKAVITREYDSFRFVEDTKFKVLTGVARAKKENVSGDNFSILKLETGEVMIALSDGMGTGTEAGEESETVMSLLEQMIEAGFKTETAIKLINSSLVLKSDKQTFSTIDMAVINLFSGMCEFIKIGAAAAFIKRDRWVETISSTTLPIGMFGNVDFDAVTKKLYEGDIIIMVTDGVLDCFEEENKEAAMEQFLLEIQSNNPQEIANRILDHMLSKSNYVPRDDMTVITAGIWQK